MTNPLVTLGGLGQSPWYDFITRDLVRSGELARLIREDGLLGMTSNPTIFEKAVAGSSDYDADIRRLAGEGKGAAEVFEALAVADVQAACDLFRPVWEARKTGDGTVSLEVSPTLAHDTAGTIAEAQRLWDRVARPNVMIKIPGTREGLPAITECLARGINVNVTLLFSVERHREVIAAFFAGLERRVAAGAAVDRLCSVASFFVSRVDGRIDPMLDAKGEAGAALRGTIAIANAAAAYGAFEAAFRGPRWEALAARGAQVQRPLWASTSTKDPKYPDTYYVEALVAPHTVNTLPPETFAAYRDHGHPEARMAAHVHGAEAQLGRLATFGVSLAEVTDFLERDGVQKFAASYQALLDRIQAKAGELARTA
ncbi:MAG TPA: transaldolase [Gemmatimonadales bacterium]|nr:transaldolase [Gemmatimonadales bacterium]